MKMYVSTMEQVEKNVYMFVKKAVHTIPLVDDFVLVGEKTYIVKLRLFSFEGETPYCLVVVEDAEKNIKKD
ncbi:MAG: hypothetical protein ACOCP4_01490 [Candidatus Woesearchaeota archaeon]